MSGYESQNTLAVNNIGASSGTCLLYTSDAADE